MKQIQVWPNHVRIADIDLVIVHPHGEDLTTTLDSLARLGFDTERENVEVHRPIPEPDGPV
jgi:hypothetical protein